MSTVRQSDVQRPAKVNAKVLIGHFNAQSYKVKASLFLQRPSSVLLSSLSLLLVILLGLLKLGRAAAAGWRKLSEHASPSKSPLEPVHTPLIHDHIAASSLEEGVVS